MKMASAHILGVGAVLVGVESLNEGEHQLLHDRIHLSRGKIVELGPLELFSVYSSVAYPNLPCKNALVG